MNNLDPDVAERPDELIVYGGRGKAARNWDAFDAIVASLQQLETDQTLLVQSGKPVGLFDTHPMAPRVLIANSLLVPDWATWEEFWALEQRGLTAYGQMTAGSWIYIGTQGILQGTFQTFAAIADQRFGGTLAGRLVLTAGLGGMGGAQPLSVTMNGGVALCIDIDPSRIQRRIETRYLDEAASTVDDALDRCARAKAERRPLSVGLEGNAATLFPLLLDKGADVDIVTDQTSAHDPLYGYVPDDLTMEAAAALRSQRPDEYVRRARQSMARHCEAMVGFLRAGAEVFDYGNNLRGEAKAGGFADAFAYPGFVPAYIRPLFCQGKGPFRWVALSGDPSDIAATDAAVAKLFPDDDLLQRWLRLAPTRVAFQGLPARICWLGLGERHRVGLHLNDLVRRGEIGPLALGRDHMDPASVASPTRETEGMRDGSDAIADWPVLAALLNAAQGATWVSVGNGGGVGVGRSIHSGLTVVADGSELAERKIRRVFWTDPALGVARYADAGYEEAAELARQYNLDLPGTDGLGVARQGGDRARSG
jgi:urocanate hydratase